MRADDDTAERACHQSRSHGTRQAGRRAKPLAGATRGGRRALVQARLPGCRHRRGVSRQRVLASDAAPGARTTSVRPHLAAPHRRRRRRRRASAAAPAAAAAAGRSPVRRRRCRPSCRRRRRPPHRRPCRHRRAAAPTGRSSWSATPPAAATPDASGPATGWTGRPRWGKDPFAPGARGQHVHDAVRRSGHRPRHRDLGRARPSTPRSTGANGCEIARWDRSRARTACALTGDRARLSRSGGGAAQAWHGTSADLRHFVVRPPSHPASPAQPLPLDSLA